jgi:transposase
MDNVKFHHTVSIKEKILSKGHIVIYLPPYSPFLNPIENLFSQWKQLVRNSSPNNEDELIETTFRNISNVHYSNWSYCTLVPHPEFESSVTAFYFINDHPIK